MLPDIKQGSGNSSLASTHADKFVSIVPDYVEREKKAKDIFLKQKDAHYGNMKDIMYRVNLRDGDFMKV